MIGQEAAESVHWFNLLCGNAAHIRLENFTSCLTTWKKYAGFLSGCFLSNLLPKIKYHWFLIS